MKIHLWKPSRAIISSPRCPDAFFQLSHPSLGQSCEYPSRPQTRDTHAMLLGPPAHCQQHSCLARYFKHPTLGCTSACIYRAVGRAGKGLREKKNLISSCCQGSDAVREECSWAARARDAPNANPVVPESKGARDERSGEINQKKKAIFQSDQATGWACAVHGSITQACNHT